MTFLRTTRRSLWLHGIASITIFATTLASVKTNADDEPQQQPAPTVGAESRVSLRSIVSNGERLIELTRDDSRQTAFRFTLKTDTTQMNVTPGPTDQVKIVCDGLEFFTDMVTFRTNPEHLQISARVALNGSEAPAIQASRWFNSAQPLELDAQRGKVVLIAFWGKWCSPSLKNLPAIQSLHQEFKDKGFTAVGVHCAYESTDLEAFLKSHSLEFPVCIDTGRTVDSYLVLSTPSYVLIDKSGVVVSGPTRVPPSEKQIAELLASPVTRSPVSCVLMKLNKPGTVEVEVSVGFEDGIRPGDKLDAIHEGMIVGKVEITQAEASRSKARIIEVVPGKALDRGDTLESLNVSPTN